MRKVSWPKGKELVSYTITVIATVAFVAVFFAIVDLLISQVLNRLQLCFSRKIGYNGTILKIKIIFNQKTQYNGFF